MEDRLIIYAESKNRNGDAFLLSQKERLDTKKMEEILDKLNFENEDDCQWLG
jgi:hypothetical protein